MFSFSLRQGEKNETIFRCFEKNKTVFDCFVFFEAQNKKDRGKAVFFAKKE